MQKRTEGVELLTGDPRRAIIRLSGPMVVAMLLLSAYNLADAIWVAGLGYEALAAVGFVGPVFMVLIGLGIGLGAGVTSAIARRIGAGDKSGADRVATHAIVLSIAVSAVLTVPLVLLAGPIVTLLGAGPAAPPATVYGQIIFGGTIFVIFTNLAYAVLRGEGDTKRTMYAMAASSVLNIVLDPILIYWAGWGIAGAAWATVISIAAVSVLILYWFLVRADTYVRLSFSRFSLDRSIIADIFRVGIPASLEFALMSVLVIILNGILVLVSGTNAVAVYAAGWRVVTFAIIPFIAIGTSVVSVSGAAYGARQFDKIRIAHRFGVGIGIVIGIVTSALTWVLAPAISLLFSYSEESAHLAPSIVIFLRIMCLFYPFVPPGLISGSVFQGTGKGMTSLFLNLLRQLVFIAICAWVFAIPLGMNEIGVWWGIVAGDILGGIVAYGWARLYIGRICASAG
ncbi:MATE family efflux transporter [Methanofollis fontis]|uniref:MATE family efflux transporter n=1 Tax=Methanofollis fontis TaxID=2052832 RepID=A0A483CQ99_9EURY|nr:MATE family efflux transporter [Methanofollis fontis]TAJ43260.1 MATE family efflux transporter [Methanofollis fontis]